MHFNFEKDEIKLIMKLFKGNTENTITEIDE